MLQYVHQVVSNCACCVIGVQWVYWRFFIGNSYLLLMEITLMRAVRPNSNSKFMTCELVFVLCFTIITESCQNYKFWMKTLWLIMKVHNFSFTVTQIQPLKHIFKDNYRLRTVIIKGHAGCVGVWVLVTLTLWCEVRVYWKAKNLLRIDNNKWTSFAPHHLSVCAVLINTRFFSNTW